MLLSLMRSSASHYLRRAVHAGIGRYLLGAGALILLGSLAYNKIIQTQLQLADVSLEASKAETQQVQALANQLGRALVLLNSYEAERADRARRNEFALETLAHEPDTTLELPVPTTVVQFLRPPIRADPARGALTVP